MLFLKVISDDNTFNYFRKELDDFIVKRCDNPFFLSGFLGEFIDLCRFRGAEPVVLVAVDGGRIVGFAPLALMNVFNVKIAKFMFDIHFSPEFVVYDECADEFGEMVEDFLFYNLGCQMADLVLPLSSACVRNLNVFRGFKDVSLRVCPDVKIGHCVLDVAGSWGDFEKRRGSNIRRMFRRIERNMKAAGGYEVIYQDEWRDSVFNDILYIERRSWKENWRRLRRIAIDLDLLKIWRGIGQVHGRVPEFKWRVYFLKINGELASYALTLQFKRTGYIAKISFNEKYRRFYPGVYVSNVAVKGFFDGGEVDKVDFQTNLDFMRYWRPKVCPRVRVILSRRRFYRFAASLLASKRLSIVKEGIYGRVSSKLPLKKG